jgi:hypothetical protein
VILPPKELEENKKKNPTIASSIHAQPTFKKPPQREEKKYISYL